ncbi:MAG: class I SAM-dependent methyltransferase [Acidimicrobiia bacterium]
MTESTHDAVVRDSFERQRGLFTGESSPFARRPASPLTWLDPLRRDMVVLDVACGAAHAAEQVAPHVRQVLGIDLTPALLEVAAARFAEAGIDNVLLQEGNAAALPFVDASFDLVICRTAVHHFPEPEKPVAEMARVCRPGGRVVVADMVAPAAEVRPAFDDVHRRIDPSHAGCLLDHELAELLGDTVGPVTYGETWEPLRLPIEAIMTEVADRDAVNSALRAELDGGPATGLQPVEEDGELTVSFTIIAIQALRPGP